jgi:hypothetical protein
MAIPFYYWNKYHLHVSSRILMEAIEENAKSFHHADILLSITHTSTINQR